MNGQMHIVSTHGIIFFHCKKHPKSHHELRVILEELTVTLKQMLIQKESKCSFPYSKSPKAYSVMSEFHSTVIFTSNFFRHILPTCKKCMDVYVCVCVHIHTHTHRYICMHTHAHTHTHTHTHIYIYIYTHTHTHTHTHKTNHFPTRPISIQTA